MAPDDLKFVRMEARLQEQQQQLMAELGLADASRASCKGQATAVASTGSNQQQQQQHCEAPIVSKFEEPTEAKMIEKQQQQQAQDELQRPLAGGRRKVSYGTCETTLEAGAKNELSRLEESRSSEVGLEADGDKEKKKLGNKLAGVSCELAQFERNVPEPDQTAMSGGAAKETDDQEADKSLIQRLAKVIPCFGILLALGASFCLGTAGMLVKLVDSVHGIEVAVLRAFIQLFIYVTIIIMRHPSRWLPERKEMLPVAARSLLGGASITFSYGALKLIPLGDATTIRFSLPIWTLIMGYFLLGESCSFHKIVAVVCSLMGVTLVAKPDDCVRLFNQMAYILLGNSSKQPHGPTWSEQFLANESFTKPEVPPDDPNTTLSPPPPSTMSPETALIDEIARLVDSAPADSPPVVALGVSSDPLRQFEGCSLALASSVCLAMSIIALRLCKRTPSEVVIFWLSAASAAIGTVALVLMGEWSVPSGWLDCAFILLNGLCGALGQWFMTNALKVEQSGLVSLARTFDIEVAFLYSALLLGEQIRMTSIIGSVLVSLGVIIVLLPRLITRNESAAATQAVAAEQDAHSETNSTTTSTTVSVERHDERGRANLAAGWPNEGVTLDGRRSFADALAVDRLRRKLSERVETAAPAESSQPESPPAMCKPLV